MFTGIIEEVGEVLDIGDSGAFRRIRIGASAVLKDLALGSSVSANGVCITALAVGETTLTAELSRETLKRTTFGRAAAGFRVNLERPMRAGDPLGGHIVQGHVDGVGRILRFDAHAGEGLLQVSYDPAFSHCVIWKGSVAVDGISLTVAGLSENAFDVALIPHTIENTNLRHARPGDEVNIEFDVLAKYVEKLAAPYLERLR